jgi:hypothetical protein
MSKIEELPAEGVPGEMPEIPTRRAKMLMVNPADFMYLFTKGLRFRKNTQIISGVPDDAKLLTIAAEPARGAVMLVVESESYPEILISEMPPVELVEIQTGEKGATKKKVVRKKRK